MQRLMTMNKQEIGQKIRAFRKERGLTMNEVALKVGGLVNEDIPRSTAAQWEGLVDIPLTRFLALCEVLGTSPDRLLYGNVGLGTVLELRKVAHQLMTLTDEMDPVMHPANGAASPNRTG